MQVEKFKKYAVEFISVLKEKAKKIKLDVSKLENKSDDFKEGQIIGYYSVFCLLDDFDPDILLVKEE